MNSQDQEAARRRAEAQRLREEARQKGHEMKLKRQVHFIQTSIHCTGHTNLKCRTYTIHAHIQSVTLFGEYTNVKCAIFQLPFLTFSDMI